MMRERNEQGRGWLLLLVLVLCLGLSACGDQAGAGTLAGGTWTRSNEEIQDVPAFMASYVTPDQRGPIPAGWTLPEDFPRGEDTRVEVRGDKILYGPCDEVGGVHGFTVATYADGQLRPIYQFDRGVVRTWQRFFSPDGTKLVAVWAKQAKATHWNVTLVDLATGEESRLKLPEMTFTVYDQKTHRPKKKSPELILSKWQDDEHLIITGTLSQFSDSSKPISYTYTLPRS